MVAKNDELVDVFTLNSELEELMLTEYPGILTEEQCHIDTSETGVRMCCFYNLPYSAVLNFLRERDRGYVYEIRRSHDGMPVYPLSPSRTL